MTTFLLIVFIVCGCITVTVLGCVSMGTSYAEKKRGLQKGASIRDIDTLRQQVNEIEDKVDTLNKQLQELIKIAKGIAD